VLRDQGIDAARISHGEPSSEPIDGTPVVKIAFQALGNTAGDDVSGAPPADPGEM